MLDRNLKIAIPCPQCQQKIEETIARLEEDPALSCPGCGVTLAINAEDFRRKLGEMEQSLAEFRRKIGS